VVVVCAAIGSSLALGTPAHAQEADFEAAASSPEDVGEAPASIAVADFDENGDLDLAVANFEFDDVTILLGDGTGDFGELSSSPEPVGVGPFSIDVDFDEDGDVDLVVPNYVSDDLTILLGDGAGGFDEAADSPEPTGGLGHAALAVGDVDTDGNADLVVADFDSGGLTILLGDGTGDFTLGGTEPTGDLPITLGLADLNGDTTLDVVVGNFGSNDATILIGDGTGDFTEAPTSPEPVGEAPLRLAVADLEGDGAQDVGVANTGSDDVRILIGDGAGDFTEPPTSPEPAGAASYSIDAADLDRDGDVDLVVANYGPGNVTRPETVGQQRVFVVAADFDGDRRPDLTVANETLGNVTILLGVGVGERCQGTRATIVGTTGDDAIRGTAGRDVIDAGPGDDVVRGRGGNDLICGKDGDDTLYGQGGNHALYGGGMSTSAAAATAATPPRSASRSSSRPATSAPARSERGQSNSGRPRSERLSSATPVVASVSTASQSRDASSPRGALAITGPKKLPSRSVPGTNVRIGVPTSGPVRSSASFVSARRCSSWDSSSTWAASSSTSAPSSSADARHDAANARGSANASSRRRSTWIAVPNAVYARPRASLPWRRSTSSATRISLVPRWCTWRYSSVG